MIQKTINLYRFHELSKEVKQKVLDKYRDWNVEGSGWADYLIEEFKNDLAGAGFDNVKILYSGFGSQGDGASFRADVNIKQFYHTHEDVAQKFGEFIKADEIETKILQSDGHYFHAQTMAIESQILTEKDVNMEKLSKFEDVVLSVAVIEANKFYKRLQEKFIYLTGDDALTEFWNESDYTFRQDGTLESAD